MNATFITKDADERHIHRESQRLAAGRHAALGVAAAVRALGVAAAVRALGVAAAVRAGGPGQGAGRGC